MKQLSSGELDDLALFTIAYSFLKIDKENTKGIEWINSEYTKKLDTLIYGMYILLQGNSNHKAKVRTRVSKILNKVEPLAKKLSGTYIQLALNILDLSLPANERKYPLYKHLEAFWFNYKDLVRELLYRADDFEYEAFAEGSEKCAYLYIDNHRSK